MQYDAAKISKFAPPSFFRIRDHSCTTSEVGIALCTKLQGALLNEGNKILIQAKSERQKVRQRGLLKPREAQKGKNGGPKAELGTEEVCHALVWLAG